MEFITISSFQDYLIYTEEIERFEQDIILFRGQSDNKPLLPSIARYNPKSNTTNEEIEMLSDLKMRSELLIKHEYKNDWEWLVFAQHFGMKTRLLDWTTNPLIGLWFACSNEYKMSTDSFVYIFHAERRFLVDVNLDQSPFESHRTKILRPSLNNERIIAQLGWFTSHKFSEDEKRFVPLNENKGIEYLLTEMRIPAIIKPDILKKLSIFGVNNRTMYPDIVGLCAHLNWKYLEA